VKQPVDTVQHVFVLYKLATVGLLDASLHSRDEAGLIFEHAGNSVFHQLLGVLAIGRGHLLEPRFNVGREMYFHAFQDTGKPARGQWRCTVRRSSQVLPFMKRAAAAKLVAAVSPLCSRGGLV
jgi:hypothetical protein